MTWKPRRRLELNYQKLLLQIFNKIGPEIVTSRKRDDIMRRVNGIINSKTFTDFAYSIAKNMVTLTRDYTSKTWREAASKSSRGRKIYEALQKEMQGNVGKEVNSLIDRNVYYIKSAPLEFAERLAHASAQMTLEGRRPADIAKELSKIYPQMSKAKSMLIARTESSKASSALVQARAENLGISWYIWQGALDQRERRSHKNMQGVLVKYSNPPSPEKLVGEKSYGEYNAGETFNCFPGSTSVNLSNGCNKLWRRIYKGSIINLRLSNGTFLQATSNHPVLTANGWLPINKIQKGDYLFESFIDSGSIFNHNENKFVSSFEDTFNSLRRFCSLETSLGSELDFHGDGSKDNIDVISTDSLLSNYFMSSFFKEFSKLNFPGANIDFTQSVLGGNCSLGESFDWVFTPHRIVCLANNFFSFITAKFGHSDIISFTSISSRNNIGNQNFRYCSPTTFVELRNRKFTFSANIPVDYILLWQAVFPSLMKIFGQYDIPNDEMSSQSIALAPNIITDGSQCGSFHYSPCAVVDKFVSEFNGHVYNLQNLSSWYSITHNKIIVHNCRCYAEPLLDINDISWPHKVFYGGKIQMLTKSKFKEIM